jgi:transposase-like protein
VAEGQYSDGSPWTFTEGRVCLDCAEPLPDCENRWGTYSPRCPPCRTTNRQATSVIRFREMNRADKNWGHPRNRRSGAAAARSGAAKAWKESLVRMVSSGSSIVDATSRLGVTIRAYDRQRDRDDQFRARVEAAKLQGRAARDEPPLDDRTFGDFAAKYFYRTHFSHQLLLADAMENLTPRSVVMVLMAPESGKTATIEDYMCRKIALDPSHRFRVISEAADLSQRIVQTCSRRFTDTEQYPEFIGAYGPFYEKGQERAAGKPWTSSQITVWKNPGTERDRNIVAQSWSGANYGSRIDTLIIDDVISQRNVGESKKIFDRIRGTFFNRGKQLRTIIVGTRIQPGDVYDMFIDAGIVTAKNTIIVPATGFLGAEPGYPTTPEMWENLARHDGGACCPPGLGRECPKNGEWLTPKEYLDLMRFGQGEEAWWASYMQNPRDDAVSTFGDSIEDCKDKERPYGPASSGLNILSIDPALGGGTALVAASVRADRLDVLDAYTVRGLARTEQQIELIAQYARRYKPSILIVEYDAQQKGLGNDDRLRALGRQLGFTIVPHTTRGQKFDVPYAVASMNQSFVKHEISIPWADEETRQRMEVLVHQLRGWRIPEKGKRDTQIQDLVMALWFIWRYWMQTRGVADKKFERAKRPSWLSSSFPDPRARKVAV